MRMTTVLAIGASIIAGALVAPASAQQGPGRDQARWDRIDQRTRTGVGILGGVAGRDMCGPGCGAVMRRGAQGAYDIGHRFQDRFDPILDRTAERIRERMRR